MKNEREENPFEEEEIAKQWINSVENERGMTRDNEIYPMLESWASQLSDGVLVDIGSGQGICSQHLGTFGGTYVAIEPSPTLVTRAKKLYGGNKAFNFLVGGLYSVPLENNSADAVFSLNVWYHLKDLNSAAKEVHRILKEGAIFNIVTANPASYNDLIKLYENYTEDGILISGRVNVPINPLSRNDFYRHSQSDLVSSFENNGLTLESITPLGSVPSVSKNPLFISIQGKLTAPPRQ